MCQLTLLDFSPKTFIPRTFIRSLSELNAYGWSGKNDDGFGYMTFAKPGEITKSHLDAISWWDENEKEFLRAVRNANGIYHVRMASNNIKDIHDKDAHPFKSGDIVLAHNGTLVEKKVLKEDEDMQKLFEVDDEKEPMIDSQKFTQILANVVGNNKLTPNHIDLAMENFTGAFCFLIYDVKQPKTVFVVRGKDRVLHLAEFFDASDKSSEHGKPIGIAINTGRLELTYWGKLVKMAYEQYSKTKLNIRLSVLDEETIWKYRVGSYRWGKPVAQIKQRPAETVVYSHGRKTTTHHHGNINRTTTIPEPSWMELVDISMEMGFYMREVFIMAELIFGQALHILDEESIDLLLAVMEDLQKQNYKGRKKEWESNLSNKNLSPIEAYKLTGMEFPYVFSSKKDIRRNFSKIKEGN